MVVAHFKRETDLDTSRQFTANRQTSPSMMVGSPRNLQGCMHHTHLPVGVFEACGDCCGICVCREMSIRVSKSKTPSRVEISLNIFLYPYRLYFPVLHCTCSLQSTVVVIRGRKSPAGIWFSVLRRWISISRHTQIPQQSTQASRTPTGRCGALSLEGIVAIRPPWREHAVASDVMRGLSLGRIGGRYFLK